MAVLTQPRPTDGSEPQLAQTASGASIDLYWLPLGAGGWFVRLNGRIYEAIHSGRVASSTWLAPCRARSGAETSSGRARCGTRTR